MRTTDTDSPATRRQHVGLGVGDAWQPFWGSDFFMPAAWIASRLPGVSTRPRRAGREILSSRRRDHPRPAPHTPRKVLPQFGASRR